MDFLCGQMKCGGILLDSYLIYWGKSISKNAIILSKSSGIDRCPMAYKSFLIFPIPFSYQKKKEKGGTFLQWRMQRLENGKWHNQESAITLNIILYYTILVWDELHYGVLSTIQCANVGIFLGPALMDNRILRWNHTQVAWLWLWNGPLLISLQYASTS